MLEPLCHAGYSHLSNFNSQGYPQKPWISCAKPDAMRLGRIVHKFIVDGGRYYPLNQ